MLNYQRVNDANESHEKCGRPKTEPSPVTCLFFMCFLKSTIYGIYGMG